MIVGLAFVAGAMAVLGIGFLFDEANAARRPRRSQRPTAGRPALLGALAGLGRSPAWRAVPGDLELRISVAGSPGGLNVRDVMAAKLGGAIVSIPLAAAVGALAPGRIGLLVTIVAPVAGFLAPDLWLHRRALSRAAAVRRELPELLDLLRVTVDAGVSLSAALAAVGDRADGLLADEWSAVGREVALGVPLEESLAALERRLPLPEIRMLVGAIDRTRRHGVPLGETLATQASNARLMLGRCVREEAAKAGPKIQLVVALLLVPSVLLLVAAALIAALAGSGPVPI